jgi:uncharacterized membrane protein
LKNIFALQLFLFKNTSKVKLVLCLMYLAGFIGLFLEITRPIFLQLTSFNLWVSLVLLLFFHENWNKNHIYYFVFIFLFGFFIEVLGVKTGFIFGEYNYGNTLGNKIFQVPISIGANWLLLTYVFTHFSKTELASFTKNRLAIAFIASLLMTLLDYLIEPIAIKFDFWHWKNGFIPIQNYVAWFFVSFSINYFILSNNLVGKNNIAKLMLILQLVFFLVHNLFNQ